VLEHAFGRPAELPRGAVEDAAVHDIAAMTAEQRAELRRRALARLSDLAETQALGAAD
jgi:hypothetical protein